MIGGFSQGAVMCYALGLGAGRPRPAGVLALSGFIPTVEGFTLDLERPLPPIAIGHGTYDPVIGVEWGRQAKERLEAAGADVLYRESSAPAHDRPALPRRATALGSAGRQRRIVRDRSQSRTVVKNPAAKRSARGVSSFNP